MKRSRLVRASAGLVLGLAIVAAAAAPDPATVTVNLVPGEEKEVCAGVQATVAPEPQHGTLRVVGDPKGVAPAQVFYKAADTPVAATDSLTCTAGTDKKPLRIEIATKGRSPVTGFSDDVYPEAFKALFLLFAVATVLESALAVLFNWRPFVETFNARAVRPVVSLIVSLAIVFPFRLDIVSGLARLISPDVPALDWTGKILTAMVIAGGSAAVNNLLVSLGFRQVRTPETSTPKPPLDKGWISVSIVRTTAITGPVTVCIGVATAGNVPVVASLDGSTRPGWRYFLRDRGRFPGSGGYAVKKGDVVTVRVQATRADGSGILDKTWGPETIGDGAIVDLTFTMWSSPIDSEHHRGTTPA